MPCPKLRSIKEERKRNLFGNGNIQPDHIIQQLCVRLAETFPRLNHVEGLLVLSAEGLPCCIIHISKTVLGTHSDSRVEWPACPEDQKTVLIGNLTQTVVIICKEVLEAADLVSGSVDSVLALCSTGTDTLFVHVCENIDLTSDVLSNENFMASNQKDGDAANGFGEVLSKRMMLCDCLGSSAATANDFVSEDISARKSASDYMTDSPVDSSISGQRFSETESSEVLVKAEPMENLPLTLPALQLDAEDLLKESQTFDSIYHDKTSAESTEGPFLPILMPLMKDQKENKLQEGACSYLPNIGIGENTVIGVKTIDTEKEEDQVEELVVMEEEHIDSSEMEMMELIIDLEDTDFVEPQIDADTGETPSVSEGLEISQSHTEHNSTTTDVDEANVYQQNLVKAHLRKKCFRAWTSEVTERKADSEDSDEEERNEEFVHRFRFQPERELSTARNIVVETPEVHPLKAVTKKDGRFPVSPNVSKDDSKFDQEEYDQYTNNIQSRNVVHPDQLPQSVRQGIPQRTQNVAQGAGYPVVGSQDLSRQVCLDVRQRRLELQYHVDNEPRFVRWLGDGQRRFEMCPREMPIYNCLKRFSFVQCPVGRPGVDAERHFPREQVPEYWQRTSRWSGERRAGPWAGDRLHDMRTMRENHRGEYCRQERLVKTRPLDWTLEQWHRRGPMTPFFSEPPPNLWSMESRSPRVQEPGPGQRPIDLLTTSCAGAWWPTDRPPTVWADQPAQTCSTREAMGDQRWCRKPVQLFIRGPRDQWQDTEPRDMQKSVPPWLVRRWLRKSCLINHVLSAPQERRGHWPNGYPPRDQRSSYQRSTHRSHPYLPRIDY